MDFRAGIGSLACRLCAASYQMPIHHLHEPVDVFSEWLDDCEAAAQGRNPAAVPAGGAQVPRYQSDDDEEEENLPAPSGLSKEKTQTAPKKKAGSGAATSTRPSYNDLGLDDSEEDSD